MLRGNPGRRPVPAVPAYAPLDVTVPREIVGDALARTEWIRVAAPLRDAGVVTEVSRSLLILYAATYGAWRRLERQVAALETPLVPTASGGQKPHPLFTLERATSSQLLKISAELGLTPASRARVSSSPPPVTPSKWSGLLP
jgi:P27 family predicted phage terminase small subunit